MLVTNIFLTKRFFCIFCIVCGVTEEKLRRKSVTNVENFVVKLQLANVPWGKVQLQRTDRGKPYVKEPHFDFGLNVTHQVACWIFVVNSLRE